jgi:hypothetical protein
VSDKVNLQHAAADRQAPAVTDTVHFNLDETRVDLPGGLPAPDPRSEALVCKYLALQAGRPEPRTAEDGNLFVDDLIDRHGRLTESGEELAGRLHATGAFAYMEPPPTPRRPAAEQPPSPAPARSPYGASRLRNDEAGAEPTPASDLAYRAARGDTIV